MATSSGEDPPTQRPSLCSDSLLDQPCQPCEREGRELESTGYCNDCSEYLCEECYSCHTRPTPMKSHSLLRLNETTGETTVSTLPEQSEVPMPVGETSLLRSTSMRLTERCPEHEELIKFFCEPHEQLSCDVCMTVHHRDCRNISYIPAVAKDIRGGEEYQEFNKQKQMTETRANEVIAGVNQKAEMIRHSHAMAKTAREEFKKDLVEMIDKQLAKLNILAVASETKETEKLDSIVNSFTRTIAEIKTLSDTLDNQQGRTNQCSLYIALKRAKAKLADIEKSLHTLQSPEVKECWFEPGRQISDLLSKGNALGKSVIVPVKETRVNHNKDICIKTTDDANECKVTGLTMLPSNKLVVIDNKNNKVKVVDTKRGKLVSWLKFSHPVWGVAKISDVRIVVTIPEVEKLAVVKNPHELVVESFIKVSARCYGVACTGDTLIVSFADTFPDKVEILDFRGKILRSIFADNAGEWIFSGPKHVSFSPTSRKIYISNSDSQSVVTMDMNGNIKSVNKIDDLNMPGKVVHDGKNRLYVCDSNTNTVHQLSMDLRKQRRILTGLNGLFGPSCVLYEEETERLYVGMSVGIIKVFQLH